MRTFVAFAAAAAFIAGVAAANAQSSTSKQETMPGAMNTNAAWCLQDKGSQAMNCKFASQADCQKEAKAQGTCVQNSKAGTTGAGGAAGAADTKKK